MDLDWLGAKFRDKEPVMGEVEYNYMDEAEDILGPAGAMLAATKSAYPGEDVYWNACVFTKEGVQIWHGDFHYGRDGEKLQELANKIGQKVILTPEQPFRFHGLKEGRKSYSADRIVEIDPQ